MGRKVFKGQEVRYIARFYDEDGALADPTTITFATIDPSGNETNYTHPTTGTTKDAVGVYFLDFDADEGGVWEMRSAGTGAVTAAYEQKLMVETSNFS